MTDRELLEKAAKAAGYEIVWNEFHPWNGQYEIKVIPEPPEPYSKWIKWNPLADEGDALRLSLKLRINLIHTQEYIGGQVLEIMEATCPADENGIRHVDGVILNDSGVDEQAATCRAIVRCAAYIGDKT